MTDEEKENIKYRLSDIGKQVGELALEYIAELEKENADLKEQIEELQLNLRSRNDLVEELTMQIEKMRCCGNCKNKNSKPTCFFCVKLSKWEMAE